MNDDTNAIHATITIVVAGLVILSATIGDRVEDNLADTFVIANIAPFNNEGKYSLFA